MMEKECRLKHKSCVRPCLKASNAHQHQTVTWLNVNQLMSGPCRCSLTWD